MRATKNMHYHSEDYLVEPSDLKSLVGFLGFESSDTSWEVLGALILVGICENSELTF